MRFPITREDLKAIDIEEERKKEYNASIKSHINSLVYKICGEIEKRMLWEKPKGMPHNHPSISMEKEAHQKIINDKRFVWEGLINIKHIEYSDPYPDSKEPILISLLIEKLKETFIGCDIIVDPLKRYVIIDWA